MNSTIIGFLLIFLMILISGCTSGIKAGIEIQEADLFCETDTDCTSIETTCSTCDCGSAVNTQSLDKYSALKKQTCAGYQGAVCDMFCEATNNICVNNKCTIVDYGPLCEGRSAQQCNSSSNCELIFGPSFCDGDICTADYVFQKCVSK